MSDGNPLPGLKDTSADITRKASSVVQILERALAGEDPAHFSSGSLSALPIALAHGYPSTKAMAANVRALKPLGDLPVTFDTPTTTKGPAMTEREIAGPIERLLTNAERHDQPRIAKKAERIRTLIDDLETAIEADREDAQKRAKIKQLEDELAKLKGKDFETYRRQRRFQTGEFPCRVDGCEVVKDTAQGRAGHERMAHDFNIKNAQAAS